MLEAERDAASAAIAAALDARLPIVAEQCWLVYLPMRGEVDLGDWVARRLAAGGSLALPCTDWERRELRPSRLNSVDDVVLGRHGVPEVRPDRRHELAVEQIDGVLVPGVAFDRRGYRLGYGGGFYDRLLPRLRPDCRVVGVAFAAQVVDELPAEAHDQRVAAVVTEQGWLEV